MVDEILPDDSCGSPDRVPALTWTREKGATWGCREDCIELALFGTSLKYFNTSLHFASSCTAERVLVYLRYVMHEANDPARAKMSQT